MATITEARLLRLTLDNFDSYSLQEALQNALDEVIDNGELSAFVDVLLEHILVGSE